MQTKIKVSALSVCIALATTTLISSSSVTAASSKVPQSAVDKARSYIKSHFNVSKLDKGSVGIRSKRRPSWALVDGSYPKSGTDGLWAVWLRQIDGSWRVKHAAINEDAFGTNFKDVPCDLEPAFSEPYC